MTIITLFMMIFGTISSSTMEIPFNCTWWFDGCNSCIVKDGQINGCTRMACSIYEEPSCIQKTKVPTDCQMWFDGCNNCKVLEKGDQLACTRKHCKIKEEPFCKKWIRDDKFMGVDLQKEINIKIRMSTGEFLLLIMLVIVIAINCTCCLIHIRAYLIFTIRILRICKMYKFCRKIKKRLLCIKPKER